MQSGLLAKLFASYSFLKYKMLPRADVEKAKKTLNEYEGIRRVLAKTTDAERAQLQGELAEAERKLKAELDRPTPREAPVKGSRETSRGQRARPSSRIWRNGGGRGG